MAKNSGQKLKLLYLVKIFMEETDEQHGLTVQEIIQKLAACDVAADRKTLYQDFEELRLDGFFFLAVKRFLGENNIKVFAGDRFAELLGCLIL